MNNKNNKSKKNNNLRNDSFVKSNDIEKNIIDEIKRNNKKNNK